MAPSLAELKQKALKAKDAGVEKFQTTRDRNTSIPMKKTNWDPYSGQPPPPPPPPRVAARTRPVLAPTLPPPSRTGSVASSTAPTPPPPPPRGSPSPAPPARSLAPPTPPSRTPSGPPPIIRSTRPAPPHSPASSSSLPPQANYGRREEEETEIDWTNLSPEDKQVFFSWLDEFFAKLLNVPIPPRSVHGPIKQGAASASQSPPALGSPKPPTWSRPVVGTSSNFTLSHPPPSTHGSAAHDIAQYFSPTTPWPQPWYSSPSNTLPPPLVGNTHLTYVSSWKSLGTTKNMYFGILFSDLSVFWGSVQFNTANPADAAQVVRDAVYLPRPKALERGALMEASESYGETIASFAESFVGGGEYCARGECWDLAAEALKYFDGFDYVPKPVPSISRTHGHLIFEGKAGEKNGRMVGRWRGGDDRVRRGDIAEWRKVRIDDAGGRSYSTLGDPDHTAIIVQDLVPSIGVADGRAISPAELGTLIVVEQSVGHPPERREYNLNGLVEGEMWIYRPVGMEVYLGGVSALVAQVPDGVVGLLKV